MFWGLTPSVDLLEDLDENLETVNILLVGSADLRHVLKTLAKRYTHRHVKINFFLMELVPEVVAKQMLLLDTALHRIDDLGLVPKTRIFMELFGNMLIRPITAKHLLNRSKELIEMITDFNYLKRLLPCVDLDLKYKERDYIENVFKFWSSQDEFDVHYCWDRRLRKTLGVRYDTRTGVFDWDLHMRLHDIGGKQICPSEYTSFRSCGVAFTWLESEVSKPNRSMVTGLLTNGDQFGHYGYLGDMQTGPFVSYGLQCEDPEFLKRTNTMNKYRATDLTERNLRQIFHEIEFQSEYSHNSHTDLGYGGCVAQPDLKVVDSSNIEVKKFTKTEKRIELIDVQIHFWSIDHLKMFKHKEKFKDFFNLIYFANGFVKYIEKDTLLHISSSNCKLLIENPLFVVNYREKELKEYNDSIMEKLSDLEMEADPFDQLKDFHMRFTISK
ncbi:PREDICTED: dynein assembly factor 3, axonemal homolog [Nicrophorus vespilloides]|uniref:Dynein assembly factor 3, axonemal homolog n=1 Tax=Nicrophorus vespilloides TaxID=110193 RepID=A0ABM1M183_NICVS|nr:PREDICTED: dynein assembly factor 3, axonemal homolog [Nicrophorus vespilloides]